MLQQAWSIEIVVERTIGDGTANRGAREWTIVSVLPAHRQRCEVPVVSAGDAGAIGVCFLMTAGTIQCGHAFAFGTTHDVGNVTVSIVALLGIVCGGVAVDATRVCQDGIDLIPCGKSLCGSWGTWFVWFCFYRRGDVRGSILAGDEYP
jgi:hypothetical protein